MNSSAETFYKFLTPQGTGGHSFYVWPKDAWTPVIEYSQPLEMCKVGYHVLTADQLLGDYMQAELWRVDVAGEIVRGDDKLIVRQARLADRIETWNDRTALLFACDCAERVLPIWYKHAPNDQRPFQAIECARRFVEGKATLEELDAAAARAWDAARAAARAWDAARAAARAWAAARDAARAAAGAAAGAAARDAAWAAARAAAGDAERTWQKDRLAHYLKLAA